MVIRPVFSSFVGMPILFGVAWRHGGLANAGDPPLPNRAFQFDPDISERHNFECPVAHGLWKNVLSSLTSPKRDSLLDAMAANRANGIRTKLVAGEDESLDRAKRQWYDFHGIVATRGDISGRADYARNTPGLRSF